MKQRFIKSISFIFCLVLLVGLSGTTASKAKSKDTIKVTLTVGKTYQLKVTGTKKKIKWNTSNKKVATVSNKGKIKAKKAGKVKIYAKIGKKKLICYLTVKAKKATKNKNTNAKSTATKKPGNVTTSTQIVQPGTTQAPANSTAPIVSSGPVVTPATTVESSATVQPTVAPTAQPEYTDGPKLEQTYHANLHFLTDDWTSNYGNNMKKGYILNSTNGFFCYDSLGNYITNNIYKINDEEVTIDHAGIYSFKISGLNNMLQNAKSFNTLFIDTDIGVNNNIKFKNIELYMDGQLVKSFDRANVVADDKCYLYLKNIYSNLSAMKATEELPIPKDSIEIRCYIDPGQPSGITRDTIENNYNIIKNYIDNYDYHNDFALEEYSDYNLSGKGIVLEDSDNLYTISFEVSDSYNSINQVGWMFKQYDKKTKQPKIESEPSSLLLEGIVEYTKLNDEYLLCHYTYLDLTSSSILKFEDHDENDVEATLNTEANQEFQRSLSAWNQLLQERLHMSLKDLGFLSYE